MKLFIFGLGYSATNAANKLGKTCFDKGGWVAATARSVDKVAAIKKMGLKAHLFDGAGDKGVDHMSDLTEATHLLVSISPGENDPVLRHFGDAILASPNLQWIGYYSTVGVYGDHKGAFVGEDGICYPVSVRSRQRVVAEKAWRDLADKKQIPLATLRLAGIYGPGRNALVNLSKGTARRIIKPDQVFNRIHVDDIGNITKEIATLKADGIFNGADDEPAPPQDVVEYAANLMNLPVPPDIPFEEANLSPMGLSFYGETKRVTNGRLKKDLNYELVYPTYRKAFDAMWANLCWENLPVLKDIN